MATENKYNFALKLKLRKGGQKNAMLAFSNAPSISVMMMMTIMILMMTMMIIMCFLPPRGPQT